MSHDVGLEVAMSNQKNAAILFPLDIWGCFCKSQLGRAGKLAEESCSFKRKNFRHWPAELLIGAMVTYIRLCIAGNVWCVGVSRLGKQWALLVNRLPAEGLRVGWVCGALFNGEKGGGKPAVCPQAVVCVFVCEEE